MRLLVVSQYFWPENFRINDLVAELVDQGHQVTVLTGYPNYPTGVFDPKFRAAPEDFIEFKGAEVVRVPLTARGTGGVRLMLNYLTFAIAGTVGGLYKLRGRRFDAVFCYQLSPVTVGLPAAAISGVKKAPLAMWVLDLWPDTLAAIGVVKSPFLLALVGRMVSFIYKRCDLILSQSHSFIPKITKLAGADARVEYFPSWAEGLFDMNNVRRADEIPPAPDKFTIMFAGNVGDAQDFPAIVAAAEALKADAAIRWIIVGDGRRSEWLADEVERRGLSDCFILMGRYPVERMPSFFAHADALLVSLKDEQIFAMTIPGKVQSYLASGIPLLAMLNGEGAEVVKRSGAGLTCNAGDYLGLVDAVRRMVCMSSAERALMGQRGVESTTREFHRETIISGLAASFADLVRQRKFGGKHV